MSAQAADKLEEALLATQIVEPVSKTYRDGSIELLCRIKPEHHDRWVALMTAVKKAEKRDQSQPYKWRSRLFLEYFLKEDDAKQDHIVKGWVVYVQSNMLLDALDVISSTLRLGKAQPLRSAKQVVNLDDDKVDEIELTGLSPDHVRNAPKPVRDADGNIKISRRDGNPIMSRGALEVRGGK